MDNKDLERVLKLSLMVILILVRRITPKNEQEVSIINELENGIADYLKSKEVLKNA